MRVHEVLDAIGPPIFGLHPQWGGHRMVGGGSDSARPIIRLRHRKEDQWVEVATGREGSRSGGSPDWQALHRWFMVRTMHEEDVEFPLEFRIERSVVPFIVDGEPCDFTVIGDGLSWVAYGLTGGKFVEIDARNVPVAEVALATASVSILCAESAV